MKEGRKSNEAPRHHAQIFKLNIIRGHWSCQTTRKLRASNPHTSSCETLLHSFKNAWQLVVIRKLHFFRLWLTSRLKSYSLDFLSNNWKWSKFECLTISNPVQKCLTTCNSRLIDQIQTPGVWQLTAPQYEFREFTIVSGCNLDNCQNRGIFQILATHALYNQTLRSRVSYFLLTIQHMGGDCYNCCFYCCLLSIRKSEPSHSWPDRAFSTFKLAKSGDPRFRTT